MSTARAEAQGATVLSVYGRNTPSSILHKINGIVAPEWYNDRARDVFRNTIDGLPVDRGRNIGADASSAKRRRRNELLFEGSLLLMAQKVRAMKPIDRRHLKISLPDRIVRPHTFKDDSLAALIDDIPVVG